MARKAATCVVQSLLAHGQALVTGVARVPDPLNGSTTVVDQAAVEAAVALLEADAATPTQAHVTALRTVWNALVLDIGANPNSLDVVLSYNTAKVTNREELLQAVTAIIASLPFTL